MDNNQEIDPIIILPTLDIFIDDQWEKTKRITAPRFSVAKELFPNQDFQVIIFLTRYGFLKSKLKVQINCHIENSKGDIVLPNKFEIIVQDDSEEGKGLILLPKLPQFKFDQTNEEGEYTIVVHVDDFISGEKDTMKKTISLNKKSPSQFVEVNQELEEWRQNYYLDPKPAELIPYYLKSMEKTGINNDANILFYVEALNNSLFLMEDISQLLLKGEISRLQRNGLILLIARCNYEKIDLEGFSKQELEILHKIRNEGVYNPLHQEHTTNPLDLDMLWSLFFANGKYENVEKIISTLEYKKDKNIEDLESLTYEDKLDCGISAASEWSLEAIGNQHNLVRTYCIYKLNTEGVSEYLANELISILTNIDSENQEEEQTED